MRPLQGTVRFDVLQHQVDRTNFRFGTGSERLTLRCPAGASAPIGYSLPPAPVIEELSATVWVFCNRPGAQLAAMVVLPRSIAPDTGQPRMLVVRGSNLGHGGQWEQLHLAGLPTALSRMARVARMQYNAPIDEREAYVTNLVLLVPGGPGVSDLWVDRVEVHGLVENPHGSTPTTSETPGESLVVARNSPAAFPRVPRVIRWQGEPFDLLARLGFQAAGMGRLPSMEELAEAKRLGILLVCPPPSPEQIESAGIAAEWESVLAWDLGDQVSAGDLTEMLHWQQLLERHDPRTDRPVLLASRLHTREASRVADALLLDRPTLGTDLSLADYATWLTQRSRLARPGTRLWTRLDSQLSSAQLSQITALGGAPAIDSVASYEQLVALSSAAIGVKSRGFYIDSDASLAQQNEPTLKRTQVLELLNIRMSLIEPWIAAGELLASARSSDPRLTALVLQAERSQLLVPIWWEDKLRSTGEPVASGPFTFVVPGVAESSDAYLLTLGGPQRLRHQRVTGGLRVSVEQLPADGLVLLTDDATAFSHISRYLRTVAPRAIQLRRNLSAMRWQASARAYPAIAAPDVSQEELQEALADAKRSLAVCDQYAAARNFEAAYLEADNVARILAASDYRIWHAATAGDSIAQNPLTLGITTLADLVRMKSLSSSEAFSENLLARGGFEDLRQLLDAGWRHEQLAIDGIATTVRLSPTAPHGGSYCLELEATSAEPLQPATVVPSAPVWVTSPTVPVHAGDLIEITGQVRVAEELLGSVDGLEISESLGGPELAVHVKSAPSWQPFRIVRSAAADADLTVTIALTGLGSAHVDDVAIRIRRSRGTPPATPLATSRPDRLADAP